MSNIFNVENSISIGNGLAINADCLYVMDEMIRQWIKVDAVITDPPYWVTAAKWDSIIPFDEVWKRLNKIVKKNGAILLFGIEPFSSRLRLSNEDDYKYDIIWEKERPTNIFRMKHEFGRVHEVISVFYKWQPTYNPIMEERIWNYVSPDYDITKCNNNGTETYGNSKYKYSPNYDSSKKYPRSILKFNRDRGKFHPTKKPIALIEYLIKTFTNEWETILDFTAWGLTLALAAQNVNRKWICIEKDKRYFDMWIERLTLLK